MNYFAFSLFGNINVVSFFTVLLIISPAGYAERSSCDFPAIYNIGDGNSDTGGFTTLFGGTPRFFAPGRSSDGRLIIDFIASSLGKPFLSHYLDSVGANFSHGANFAQLLAPTLPPTRLIIPRDTPPFGFNPIYVGLQFSQFVQFVQKSQQVRKQGGVFKSLMPKNESFTKGLYTFFIDQNDIPQGLFTNTSVDDIKKSLPDTINSFTSNLKNILYNQIGARNFLIHNTGPLGCLPYILTIRPTSDVDSVGCSRVVNDLVQYYNSILKSAVDQLRVELPSAAITYVDLYSAYYSLYLEPQRYGFELPLEACCGLGGAYNFDPAVVCGTTATVNGSEVTARPCKDPSKRIDWDGFTYTDAANKIMFEKTVNGNYSDPPNSLRHVCHRN